MEFQKTLFTFFPPPKFLMTRAAGLSLSEDAVRFVEFGDRSGKPILAGFGAKQIPEGMLKDGEIGKPEDLKKILRDFRKEHDLHFIRASVPETKSYIVKMELPRVADAEVRDAVEIHLEEYVPIPSRESVFDYKVLGFSGRDCSRMNLEVSVVHERTIQGYLEIFGGTGLTVASFENEAQAVARAVVSKNDPSTCMIVDFGAFRTGIYIVANGSIDFTTSIEMSGNMLSNMLRGKFLLSPEEIEEMKRTFDCNVFLLNEEQEAAGALMSFVSAFRDEISKHFVFWQTHRDEKNDVDKIQKIILTGSESILTGLAQYLSGSLDISVELANVWQNVFDFNEYIPEIGKRDSFQYSAAIGLALPSVSKDKEPR